MKFATRENGTPDGELLLVHRDGTHALSVGALAPSLIRALENWNQIKESMGKLYDQLNGGSLPEAFPFQVQGPSLRAVLPRTFLFGDGSAFIQHIKLVRQARGAPLPETLTTVPLMYQGESAYFLSPQEPIVQIDFKHGTDFEGEIGVLTDFVPMGTNAEDALQHIRLFVLINDISFRGLIPAELAQGFGFFQSKPPSSLSPLALTPDELGSAWERGRVHLPLKVAYNGKPFGQALANEMHFHFGELIAHAARTRPLQAGSLIGSGTVSNEDETRGCSCLAEKRMLEKIHEGEIKTPFMEVGDHVCIWMEDKQGQNLFGSIHQKVVSKQAK